MRIPWLSDWLDDQARIAMVRKWRAERMPMKYDPDTGMPRFVPDHAIEIGEGVTPEPVFTKDGLFRGDPQPGMKKVDLPFTVDGPKVTIQPVEAQAHSPGQMNLGDDIVASATPADLNRRYASDEEVEEVWQLATSTKVFHWPALIGIINRLRRAEAQLANR